MALNRQHTLRFVRVNATSDGDNTVISAPSDATRSIYVIGYSLNVNAAGVITVQDSDNTAVASFEFVDGGGASYAGNLDCPAFKLPAGKGLEVSNVAGVDTLGHITYIIA